LIKGNTAPGHAQYVNHLNSSKEFIVYGNILSWCYGDNFMNNTKTSYFQYLFNGCSKLISAKYLILTSDLSNSNGTYKGMFLGCTSLTTAPALPATILANNCYQNMFYGCTSLTTAPELPATTLVNSCY